MLSPPQFENRIVVERIAGQMKSAKPFDCDDLASPQQLRGLSDGFIAAGCQRLAGTVGQPHLRPAPRACHRLGVEPAIRNVAILPRAPLAHLENRHCGVGPVVRNGFDDRVSGTAVGAVDEGIAISEVLGVPQLSQAIPARGDIGSHMRQRRARRIARPDDKAGFALDRLHIEASARVNLGHWRLVRPRPQPAEEFVDRLPTALQFDRHALRVVEDSPGQPELVRQPVDGGPKPHPLNTTGDLDSLPLDQFSQPSCRLSGLYNAMRDKKFGQLVRIQVLRG